MRYMAAPQRSHCIASWVAAGAAAPRRDTTGVTITLWGEPIVGGTFSGGLSTAAIIRPQIGSARSSAYGPFNDGPVMRRAGSAATAGLPSQREMMAASAAATSVIVTTNEPRVTRRVITNS